MSDLCLTCGGNVCVPGACMCPPTEEQMDPERLARIRAAAEKPGPVTLNVPPLIPEGIDEAGLSAAYAAYLDADREGDSRFTLDRDFLRLAIGAYLRATP